MVFPLPTSAIHNWVCYLTARCNMNCSYCIQKETIAPGVKRTPWRTYSELTGKQWVDALNSYPVRPEHPLILTGGEPSLHRDFLYICTQLEGYRLDMTSNLTFDIDVFVRAMKAAGKTFATSFHTYHPKFMNPADFVERAERLRDSGVIEAPVFSMVNLDAFPHFRDDEHQANRKVFLELAERRGLSQQSNEFRGHHMGSAFDRLARKQMECTSAWVNVAPDGAIYNCQYHLVEGRESFGNVTDVAHCKPLVPFGTFFQCADFGFCDPCHENSGHGAFRDATGRVFRRDGHDARTYLRWMQPAEIAEVGRRYVDQGDLGEAKHAFLAAIAKGGAGGDAETWADLGTTLFDLGEKTKALGAFLHAIELGATSTAALAGALEVGRETGHAELVRSRLEGRVAPEELARIEQALDAVFV